MLKAVAATRLVLALVPLFTLLALVPAEPASATSALSALNPAFVPLPAGVTIKGSVPANESMRVILTLKANSGLQSYASEVNTPGNPNYHHYLTHQEVGQKFGQSLSTINLISSYFAAKGLTTTTGVGRMRVDVSGPVPAMQSAFNTSIQSISIPGIGVRPEATKVPSLPQSFASDIQSVVGLSDYLKFTPGVISAPSNSSTTGSPAIATAATTTYSPSTCASARLGISIGNLTPNSPSVLGYDYQIDPFYAANESGQNQTVAFLEFATFNPSDVTTFDGCFGSNALSLTTTLVDGGAQSTSSGHSEVTGDLETVASLAPNSGLVVYSAPNSSTGLLDAISQWVASTNEPIMSNSWGVCEVGSGSSSGLAQSVNTELLTAVAQGKTFISASEDQGSQCSGSPGLLSTTVPADSPNALAVGGTSISGYAKSQETAWNDAFGASGGGVSTQFPLPSYQSALGALNSPASTDYASNCPATSYPSGCRMVPDVSASADPLHGYYIYCTSCNSISSWWEIGGTSMSTPLWAAGLSLVDQACGSTKGDLALANQVLYPMADTSAFNDITSGNNDASSVTGYSTNYYTVGTGYDMVTGLGTPNFATIAEKYCNASFPPTLALTDSSLTAIQANPGIATTRAFSLVNVGFTNITEPSPSAMSISGTDSSQFAIDSGLTTCTSGNTLAPGQSCTISVSYSPTYYGSAEATLNVASTPSNSPTISLLGETSSVKLAANPPSITAYVGSQTSYPLTFTNQASDPIQLGNPPYLITGANPSAFSVGSSSTCTATIAPTSSCQLDVVYDGQASPTTDTAQLTLIDGLGTSYGTVLISGTTKYPYLSIASGPFAPSGSITVGTSATATVTITANGGSIPLSSPPITLASVPGSSDYGYSITSDSCEVGGGPITLASGQSCSVGIEFTPAVAGTFEATLTANVASPFSPAETTLTATSTPVNGSQNAVLSTSPTTLNFGQVAIGSSQSESFTISSSLAASVLDQPYLSSLPPGYSVSASGTTCSSNLLIASGGTCVVEIVFSPSSSTTISGTLAISSQPTQSTPVQVSLDGTGYTPAPAPAPAPAQRRLGGH